MCPWQITDQVSFKSPLDSWYLTVCRCVLFLPIFRQSQSARFSWHAYVLRCHNYQTCKFIIHMYNTLILFITPLYDPLFQKLLPYNVSFLEMFRNFAFNFWDTSSRKRQQSHSFLLHFLRAVTITIYLKLLPTCIIWKACAVSYS